MDLPHGGAVRPLSPMAFIIVAGITACAAPLRTAMALRWSEVLRD